MSIKLVALDLDDTLLDTGLKISEDCVRTIQEVRKRGVRVTISTGRMYRSALPYAQQLEIDVPLITYQGAWVKNSLSGEVLYCKPVPRKLAIEVIKYFKVAGVHCHSYYNDQLVMESLSEEGRFYSQLAGVEAVLVDDLIAQLDTGEAMKIMAISYDEKQLLDIERNLKLNYGDNLHITRSKPYFLEVMHREANKAKALEVIARHFGIGRQEVMAVGDSYNDIEMIEWAGLGVAMGNAFQSVKEIADFVTASNEEEGVAEALRRFIINK
ncbi:MAG: Cof-type HAD-IIB family hydrolase [Firmicutes bacterium HGW-Firmicutes-15]|nr:MAG: Cof-type HAD-IIB family hydrolase [Firmicutes bacterium HGW-Firmicutes-15]